jgi:hypothetical protein
MHGPDRAALSGRHFIGLEDKMPRNLGTIDRLVRVVLGVMILGLYGALPSPWRYLTLFGIILIATAMVSFCPIYALLGLGTRKQPGA